MGTRVLTAEETDMVSGGFFNDDFGWTITAQQAANGFSFDSYLLSIGGTNWAQIAGTLDRISSGFNNAAGVAAGVATVTGVSALVQGGVDLPNDGVFIGATLASGAGAGLGALFSYAAGAARNLQ